MSNSDTSPPLLRAASAPIALEDCGLSATASLLGDRWTLLVLRALFYGVRRFADIKSDIGIPGSTLSDRLRRLVDNGIVEVHPYQDSGARTRDEYVLTAVGESLQIVLMNLMAWGDAHLRGEHSRLVMVSKSSGETVEVGFVDSDGRGVDPDDIEYRILP